MKQSKGVIKNIETNTVNLDFGTYGLTTLESVRISANQIEAVRKVLSRKMKRSGKIWFRINADRGITSKAVGSRMDAASQELIITLAMLQPDEFY